MLNQRNLEHRTIGIQTLLDAEHSVGEQQIRQYTGEVEYEDVAANGGRIAHLRRREDARYQHQMGNWLEQSPEIAEPGLAEPGTRVTHEQCDDDASLGAKAFEPVRRRVCRRVAGISVR